MTKLENITLQEYIKQDSIWKAEDRRWKEDIEAKLKPLTEDRLDRIIITTYGVRAFKILATIIGFLISLAVLFNLATGRK